MSPKARPLIRRDRATMLDREVGDAAGRVQLVSVDKCARGARVDTQRARAALIKHRKVERQVEAGRHAREEQPGTEFGIDQAGILPNPTEPGVECEGALLHVMFVDEDRGFERLGLLLAHPRHERLQALGKHEMVASPQA